jgi:hypothetical protein
VFNYSDPFERAVAAKYRDAEVPFKVYGVPDVEAVTQQWTDEYLLKRMDDPKISYKVTARVKARASGRRAHPLRVCFVLFKSRASGWCASGGAFLPLRRRRCQVEESQDNHFMYWVNRGYKGTLGAFTPPTKNLHSLKFPEWLKIAHTADEVAAKQTRLKT